MDLINSIHNRLCFVSPFTAILGWTLSVFSYIHLDNMTVPASFMVIAILAAAYGIMFDPSHFWRVLSTMERKGMAIYYCAIGLCVHMYSEGSPEAERICDVYRLSFTGTFLFLCFNEFYHGGYFNDIN